MQNMPYPLLHFFIQQWDHTDILPIDLFPYNMPPCTVPGVHIITLVQKFVSQAVMQTFSCGYEDAASEVPPGIVYFEELRERSIKASC